MPWYCYILIMIFLYWCYNFVFGDGIGKQKGGKNSL